MKRDSTGKFRREHLGCRVLSCEARHRSKGFCRGHLSAFERGRIDAEGRAVRSKCERCTRLYVPRRSDQRFCPDCAPLRARAREKNWRRENRSHVRRALKSWKDRHRTALRRRERESARRRRSKFHTADPACHRQQLASAAARQKALQHLSRQYVRRKRRWTPQEIALLKRMYPGIVREREWERLFRILGRSYVAIRGKIAELRRRRRA